MRFLVKLDYGHDRLSRDGERFSVIDTDIHVHAVRLDVAPSKRSICWGIISDDERERAGRFAFQELRDRWSVSRAGLRAIVASYVGSSPRQLRFASEELGKPVLADSCAGAGLHFNLSHSDNLAVVAVTKIAPIGVDVELVRSIPDWRGVAGRFFSRSENAALARVDERQREHAFYNCWTRKEAVIKTTGEGLSARLDAFDVSLVPGEPATVLCDRRGADQMQPWRLQHLDPADGFVGAVATQCPNEVTVTFHGYWKIGHA